MTLPEQPLRSNNDSIDYDPTQRFTSYQPNRPDASVYPLGLDTPQPQEKATKRHGWKRALLLLFVILLTPLLVIGAWDYRNASDASEKLFGSGNLLSALPPNSLKNIEGRTNIMLVGYSADDPGHAGATLTDSIMVVSLNKETDTGFMLSVPRDLYVDIPAYGAAKINEAFQAGERQEFVETGYPIGGVGLLEKVVSENFDIPIHYYVIVNYAAVREITDALGGITVKIESPDPRGLYDPNFKPEEGGPLTLANGLQEIDGQTALRLTRARGSTYGSYGFPQSDFNRTQNQQKVFAAIKSEMSLKLLLDPRANKTFFDSVANNLKTDLTVNEILPLLQLFRSVPDSSLKQVNLRDINGKNYLGSYRTSSGQSALIPAAGITNYSDIQAVLKSLSQ